MQQIDNTLPMTLRVCTAHIVGCTRYTSIIMGLIYGCCLLYMKFHGHAFNYLFILDHKLTFFFIALAIYALPVNIIVTHQLLSQKFKQFRIVTVRNNDNIQEISH